ncbi:MAG TPA: hypothetical protein VFQ89_01780, partial [Candidatus Binatia bacterium]|nr:hypothetical protein [Candidatus Binatia bacterium]
CEAGLMGLSKSFRDDDRDRLSQSFSRGVLKDVFSRGIPEDDFPERVNRYDRIMDRFGDRL